MAIFAYKKNEAFELELTSNLSETVEDEVRITLSPDDWDYIFELAVDGFFMAMHPLGLYKKSTVKAIHLRVELQENDEDVKTQHHFDEKSGVHKTKIVKGVSSLPLNDKESIVEYFREILLDPVREILELNGINGKDLHLYIPPHVRPTGLEQSFSDYSEIQLDTSSFGDSNVFVRLGMEVPFGSLEEITNNDRIYQELEAFLSGNEIGFVEGSDTGTEFETILCYLKDPEVLLPGMLNHLKALNVPAKSHIALIDGTKVPI